MGTRVATTPAQAARKNATKTLLENLGLDLAIALGLVLNDWIGSADITDKQAWTALGVLVGKSLIASIARFLLQLRKEQAVSAE